LHRYIETGILRSGKPLVFLGSALRDLERLPERARSRLGGELEALRTGGQPRHWKPMPAIGTGVREIKVAAGGAFRAFYVATFNDAIYILHVFQKKSQKTARLDIELGRVRFRMISRSRGSE
jgi:phage-related protein